MPGGIISRADLAASDAMLAGNQQPVYFFSWDLTGSYNLYPDGDYKIRAIAVCNAVGQKISNEVTGELSRTQIIVGATEPADGIWSTGDEISISYSEMIDCGVINTPAYQDSNLIMIDTTTGLEVDFETVCLNNKIVFLPEGGMVQYDGHVLQVRAKNITNLAQNFAADAVWNFRVVAQSVDFAEEKLEVYLYQGTQLEMNTPLINTVNTFVNGLSTDQNSSATWLQIMPNNPFNVAPLGQELTFLFNGTGNVGTYTDTINVLGLIGRQPSIVVTMHILKPAPTITVTGSYQDSMYFVGNWRFDIDAELSQDTMDQILVFIGNELRGSGRIQKSGPFYHTTFTVKGDPMDNGQSLDFQIWNSDDESLYEGLHIPFDASFDAGAVLGSIYQPEVLIVEGDPILRKRIYVDSAQVTNVKNGLLWSTAFTDLDDALAIAQPFDTVWMAKGHYYPTNGSDRSLSYNGKDNVVIFGGFVSGQFSPLERTGMDETILSGDIGSVGQMLDNSYHVLTNTASGMILDGITIADANANGTGNNDTGGGIDNSGQITLRNVIFKNCNALNRGSCIRNSGNEATMILQDVQLSSPSILEWILNSDGALMTIINSGELKN